MCTCLKESTELYWELASAFRQFQGVYILSVSEKLPVPKCPYFGKYIIQLYGFFYVHVSGSVSNLLVTFH